MSELEIEIPRDEPVVIVRRLIKAPPQPVFRMYTEPEHLRRWWGPRHLDLVHPVVLGDGQRIFAEPIDIEAITTTAFTGGAVAHVCRPA